MRKFIDALKENDYQGEHQPADAEGGCALYDLTLNGVYPDDVYGPRGREYSLGMDDAFYLAIRYKGRPNRVVTVYRAVPKELVRPKINPGDWVGTTRAYAKEHGESRFDGAYKIISKTVYARDLYTDGNSIEEWGYVPQPFVSRQQEDQIRLSLGMKTVADARAAEVARRGGVSEGVIAEDMQRHKPKLPDAFWSWFGNSKVVDNQGQPLVLFHGTNANISEFRDMVWGSVDTDLAHEYASYRAYSTDGGDNIVPMYMRIERPFDADYGLSKTVTIGQFLNAVTEQALDQGVELTEQRRLAGIELIQQIKACARREESGPHYDRHNFWNSPSSYFGKDGADAILAFFKLFQFDGVRMMENDQLTYGAFSPQQVKSIFNQGAYNPEDPRISEGR